MDSSISKSVIMVAGVLLAMIVVAFITMSFRRMGSWATTQDDEQDLEQIQEFNKEFEVYDKKLMYGVDVISCLNKALSNNNRITNSQVVNGDLYDERYEIKVEVTLKKIKKDGSDHNYLTEGIRIYHMNDLGKEVEYTSNKSPKEDSNKSLKEIFEIIDQYINNVKKVSNFNFNSTNSFVAGYIDSKIKVGTYSLKLKNSDHTLENLLKLSNDIKKTVKNTSATRTKPDSWTKAVWETPLYDLKTRKFKCTGITYKESGRVDTISFEEINV